MFTVKNCRKMNNKLVICWTFVLVMFLSNKNNAQYSDLGVGLGMTTYWGDMNAPSFVTNYFGNSGLGFQAHGRYMKGNRLALRGSFVYGRINGDDSRSNQDWQLQRNLNFRSHLTELAVMGELYILPFSTEPGSNFFAPYLTAGVAAFWFDPKTTYQGREVRLQPLGTEGQGMPGRPAKYSRNSFALPFGLGAKFILTETINLGFEVVIRRSFTDYIDDLSSVYINYDDLSRSNGTLAANLSNRMNEFLGQADPVTLPTGSIRGGAQVDDYYVTTMLTLNFVFTDSKGRKRMGSNDVKCPTFR